jgi:hypothetical protein
MRQILSTFALTACGAWFGALAGNAQHDTIIRDGLIYDGS